MKWSLALVAGFAGGAGLVVAHLVRAVGLSYPRAQHDD